MDVKHYDSCLRDAEQKIIYFPRSASPWGDDFISLLHQATLFFFLFLILDFLKLRQYWIDISSLATLPLMENGNVLSRIFLSRQNLAKAGMIVQFSQILYLSHPTIWKFSHYHYKDWDSFKNFFISPKKKGRWGIIVLHIKCFREKRRKEKSKELKESKKQKQDKNLWTTVTCRGAWCRRRTWAIWGSSWASCCAATRPRSTWTPCKGEFSNWRTCEMLWLFKVMAGSILHIYPDLEFVKKLTRPDFRAQSFTQ